MNRRFPLTLRFFRFFSYCTLVLSFTLAVRAEDLVPLQPKLPAPAFTGTPKEVPAGANIDVSGKPSAPVMIPKNAVNLAPQAKLSASDANATPQALAKVVDGVKEAEDNNLLLLRKGVQYLQFDLGAPAKIYALAIWHAHDSPKVYHGVVVQTASDAAFTADVHTLFNNDTANDAKRGAGKDHEYFETFEGKIIPADGVIARYVRLYSHGSTDSSLNEYTEVEIYGTPVK